MNEPTDQTPPHHPVLLPDLLREVLPIPTAPHHEHQVLEFVRRFAGTRGLETAEDDFGNVTVRYRAGEQRRPLVLQAHTDHPGFVVTEVRGPELTLEFRGGLSAAYGDGERLRIYRPGSPEASGRARVTRVISSTAAGPGPARILGARAVLETEGEEIAPGDLALWDVDRCRIRGSRVYARQCDDLAGCVTVLAVLDRLCARAGDGDLIGLFTRAEEVGLEGAAAAAAAGTLPPDALVVAIETSSSAGGRARSGGGGIIRVGDRGHIFSPAMTRWMTGIAAALSETDPDFRYQRKLMDAGTTEATAFDLLGYETGAACLALGNWHNAGPRGRVRAETIDLGDLEHLVALCGAMVEAVPTFDQVQRAATDRWRRIAGEVGPRLRETRIAPARQER